jgi:2-dehydro-3-deoxyphosphogalactonate aldolase
MKITSVKTYVVGNPPPHRGGRNWVFLKLTTDEGIEGIGECNTPSHREHTLVRLIEELSEPFVIGTNPFDIEKLWDTLYTGVHAFHHPGIISTQVIAAYEMACWDIVGKALGQPVYNLLGGTYRDKVRAYTYIYEWHAPDLAEKAGRAAANLVEQGFTAMKFDPIPPIAPAPREVSLEELRYTDAVLKSIRNAIGDKADLLLGTHGQLNTHSAIRYAKVLEPYDPLWFEEPVPPENMVEMARVAQHTSIPIATGERLCTKYDFSQLLEQQAAQIIQAHVGLNGILELKKIAGMCEAHYAQIAPWMHCSPVAGIANVHVDVCSPNFLLQEGIEVWTGVQAEILKEPVRWEKGYIIPPDKPGLGVELDEEVIARYPYIPPQR